MKSDQPLVSVLTPVYNGSKYLDELIRSVLEQDYPRIQHIIIDDGSTDEGATVAVLKRYPHLRWWSRPNRGQCATQNEALAAAEGEFVTIISADDKYASPTVISLCVDVLLGSPEYDAVYGETVCVDESGREIDKQGPRSGPIWLLRYYPVVAHCSLLVRRGMLFDRGLLFDDAFPHSGDSDWLIRLIKAGCRFKRVRKPIAFYRRHANQRSLHWDDERIAEQRRFNQVHGEPNPLIVFIVRQFASFVKLKNLFRCRGFLGGVREIRDSVSQHSRAQRTPILKARDPTQKNP